MAGTYTDIPGTRFALDADGSVLKWRNYTEEGLWTDETANLLDTQKVDTVSKIQSAVTGSSYTEWVVAFPEARTITGIYIHAGESDSGRYARDFIWEQSTDTTDGTDGTWTSFTPTFSNMGLHDQQSESSYPYYRSDIAIVSLSNTKGIRVRHQSSYYGSHELYTLHIYGNYTRTGLQFWDETLDQAANPAHLDFGDHAQGESMVKQLRVKNLNALGASNVTVSVSDIMSTFTGLQISLDNTTYASSIDLGSIASGAISPVFYVRSRPDASESTGLNNARLIVTAAGGFE